MSDDVVYHFRIWPHFFFDIGRNGFVNKWYLKSEFRRYFSEISVSSSIHVIHTYNVVSTVKTCRNNDFWITEIIVQWLRWIDCTSSNSIYLVSIVVIAVVAASPDANVTQWAAPSKAAKHFSRTSRVGLPLRPYSYLTYTYILFNWKSNPLYFKLLWFNHKFNNWKNSYILNSAGPSCLNVVDNDIGGTTANEFHCSGSCPEWDALVAKCGSFSRNSSIFLFEVPFKFLKRFNVQSKFKPSIHMITYLFVIV